MILTTEYLYKPTRLFTRIELTNGSLLLNDMFKFRYIDQQLLVSKTNFEIASFQLRLPAIALIGGRKNWTMEPAPLIVVTSSKSISKRRALKAIDSFLESHEDAKNDTSESAIDRNRLSAVPDDIIMSLKKVKSLIIEEIVQSSSSMVKSEVETTRSSKKSLTSQKDNEVVAAPIVKLEVKDQVSKKSKRSNESEKNLNEKKKKSRI